MDMVEEARRLVRALQAVGARRLSLLAAATLAMAAAIGGVSYYLSRPQYETLYAGLEAQDASRVIGVLREGNFTFDVSSDGGTVLVEFGQAARARMALAERGLPRSGNAGYELFDKLGSLGLTSFMQEVTRVRALEGELARSIQTMQGVKSARVHLVLPDEGSFRKRGQGASASVVVRLSSAEEASVAHAIRHLVAAAAPGMAADAVTVLNTDGIVLASGADGEAQGSAKSTGLERSISEALQNNIRRTLAPIVGARHLHVSVVARLNTDKRQVNETTYNPDSRVERSVRTVKETQSAQNSNNSSVASVERNMPNDKPKNDGKSSNEENLKKEELTNYEISSRSVSTTSGGYAIERLSVAILIDKAGLNANSDDKSIAESAEQRLTEIIDLASSAAGLSKERGDVIKVAAMETVGETTMPDAASRSGLLEFAARQIGSLFNILGVVAAVAVVTFLGIRPLARAIAATAPQSLAPALEAPAEAGLPSPDSLGSLEQSPRRAGQKRLERMVEQDEEQVAAVLKQWVRAGA
jgi:flagellar M-ring protein FliF